MDTKIDESKLISGKEALIALANGEEVEFFKERDQKWEVIRGLPVCSVLEERFKFRLKPRAITINGIEVPALFKPKVNEEYWFIADYVSNGYSVTKEGTGINSTIGKWRTEEEIKQVVAALRQVFGGSHDN